MILLSKAPSGVIFALLTAIGLGSITTQAKIFYAEGGNAMTLMFIRFVVSIAVFGLVVILKREAFAIVPGQRVPTLMLGAVWSGAMICYLLSVESISVSLAVLIFYTYPILVLGYALMARQLTASV